MSALFLFGGGGHGRVVCEALEPWQRNRLRAIVDDDALEPDPTDLCPRIDRNALMEFAARHPFSFHVALGSGDLRFEITESLAMLGGQPETVVATSVQVRRGTELGRGSCLLHHAFVGPRGALGEGVIVNTGARVDHDCRLGRFAFIGPSATLCGNVVVGERAFVGAGAVLLPGVEIGVAATVGAGAVVTESVPAGQRVVGIPARAASPPSS